MGAVCGTWNCLRTGVTGGERMVLSWSKSPTSVISSQIGKSHAEEDRRAVGRGGICDGAGSERERVDGPVRFDFGTGIAFDMTGEGEGVAN